VSLRCVSSVNVSRNSATPDVVGLVLFCTIFAPIQTTGIISGVYWHHIPRVLASIPRVLASNLPRLAIVLLAFLQSEDYAKS
jgi:hypothetical protein